VAFDFMGYTSGQIQTQNVINWAQSKKGVVAFQWHWNCPHGGNYSANCDFEPDLNNMGSKLVQDIDLVVRELKKMGDAGVPVLFRPLHESNNNYMWWAKKKSDAYKKLWILIFNRAQLAGAHNIVWVFNGMASHQGTSLASWYPGDQYVDLVTSDYFQTAGDFDICKAIGAGKTPAIAETMNIPDPAKDPAWAYSVAWASRDWGGKGAEQSWKTAMANPKTISIDQLPDMGKW
jgi:Glycosyl hydrolase family 26